MTEKGCQDYLTCEECRDNGICHWSGSSCSSWEHVSPVCPSPERTTPSDLPEAATLADQPEGIGWGWIVAAGIGGFLAGTLLVYWGRRIIAPIRGRITAYQARQAHYAFHRQTGNGPIPRGPVDEERPDTAGQNGPETEGRPGTAAEGLSLNVPVEEYVRPPFLDDIDGDEDDSPRRSERLREKGSKISRKLE